MGLSKGRHQAAAVLRVWFTLMPIVTGVDKLFFDRLTDWSVYVAPVVVAHSPVSVDSLMHGAGIVEICLGVLVAARPRVGALITAIWLLAIVVNLALAHQFYDVALRDLGLFAGAVALNRLSAGQEERHEPKRVDGSARRGRHRGRCVSCARDDERGPAAAERDAADGRRR
jgi:hypothetical protein